jgi:hypothetical protein
MPGVGHGTSHHSPQVGARRVEVDDHAILQRPHRGDASRDPSEQLGGLPPNRDDPATPAAGAAPQQHRRLVEHDLLGDVVDNGVRRAKIDSEI